MELHEKCLKGELVENVTITGKILSETINLQIVGLNEGVAINYDRIHSRKQQLEKVETDEDKRKALPHFDISINCDEPSSFYL